VCVNPYTLPSLLRVGRCHRFISASNPGMSYISPNTDDDNDDDNDNNRVIMWPGKVWSVQRLATSWKVRGTNPGEGEIFRTRPDRPWRPHSLLYDGYRVSFPVIKRPGRGVNHPIQCRGQRKSRAIRLLPLCAFMTCTKANFTFTFNKNVSKLCLHTKFWFKMSLKYKYKT
jgi:hypothetical protein